MCCNMCCPQPKMCVIRPIGLAGKIRNYVKWVMIGEVVVCILHMMIFDIMSGFTHAVSVWIDFMAFSTMGFCQALVLVISASIDLGMLVFSWCRSDSYKAVINSHWFSQTSFWLIIAFFVVKLLVGCVAFAVWKKAFRAEHGHNDCCRPVVPPIMRDGMGGAGASSEPMHSAED